MGTPAADIDIGGVEIREGSVSWRSHVLFLRLDKYDQLMKLPALQF